MNYKHGSYVSTRNDVAYHTSLETITIPTKVHSFELRFFTLGGVLNKTTVCLEKKKMSPRTEPGTAGLYH